MNNLDAHFRTVGVVGTDGLEQKISNEIIHPAFLGSGTLS